MVINVISMLFPARKTRATKSAVLRTRDFPSRKEGTVGLPVWVRPAQSLYRLTDAFQLGLIDGLTRNSYPWCPASAFCLLKVRQIEHATREGESAPKTYFYDKTSLFPIKLVLLDEKEP